MPRIAVAIAVVALVAFSIGFNTSRYTVVWDMAGGPAHLPHAESPGPSATVAETDVLPQPDQAPQPVAPCDEPVAASPTQGPSPDDQAAESGGTDSVPAETPAPAAEPKAATTALAENSPADDSPGADAAPEVEDTPAADDLAADEDAAMNVAATDDAADDSADGSVAVDECPSPAEETAESTLEEPGTVVAEQPPGEQTPLATNRGLKPTSPAQQVRRLPPVDRIAPNRSG